MHHRYGVLTLESSFTPNALAALLPYVRDTTGCIPHISFERTEGTPYADFPRFFLFGQGDVAPVTREVLARRSRTATAGRASTPADARTGPNRPRPHQDRVNDEP